MKNSSNLVAVALTGAVTLFAVVALLADGTPVYVVLATVAIVAGTLWLTLFIRSRLIHDGEKDEPHS